MSTDRTDEAIRSLYRRLEPQVNTEGFCQTVGTKLAARKAGTTRRHTVRVAMVTCLAVAFVAVAGVGVYEALTHLGQPQEVLVITDEPVTPGGYVGAQAGLLSNPYPTAEAAESSDFSAEIPSAWAESLGKAILDLYPDSGWTVLRAVEVGGSLMDVSLGPDTASYGPPSLDGTPLWDTQGRPGISVQVNREESGHFPQEGNPMQYQEFATEYGHGLLGPVYHYGAGSMSVLSWFMRPDKLFLRVSAGQVPSEAAQSGPPLDEAGVQKLVEYIASIIEMGPVDTSSVVPSTSTTAAPAVSDEVQGYLDTLESTWKAAGIPVLGVTTAFPDAGMEKLIKENTEDDDPLPWVVAELPSSVFASMDYLFVVGNLNRQTMVAIRGGVPLHYLGIFEVGDDGSRTEYAAGEVYQLAQIPGPEWDRPATLALEETTDRLREAARQAAAAAGVTLQSLDVIEDASGRVVTAAGSIPDRKEVSASVAGFSGPLEQAMRALNKEGAKVSGLNVKVDDLDGAPVLRLTLSLNVGNGSRGSWLAPELKAGADWPVNARGQTYGSNANVGPENEPDLILVQATNGKTGYSLKTDLDGPMPKTPEEALAWQEARRGQPPREIPVYLSDGVTKIGVFLISP